MEIRFTLNERKSNIINSCFIDIADQDYITARWLYINGIFPNFYWSAAQALEKYLKSYLLYNDMTTIGKNHGLTSLFLYCINHSKCTDFDKIIDDKFLSDSIFYKKTYIDFVEYINHFGDPNNRYHINGIYSDGYIIYLLDFLLKNVRVLIRFNNFLSTDLYFYEYSDSFTIQNKNPSPWMIGENFILEKLFSNQLNVGNTQSLKDAFLFRNIHFSDEYKSDEVVQFSQHYCGAPIQNHTIRHSKMDKSVDNQNIIKDLEEWVRQNIQGAKNLTSLY